MGTDGLPGSSAWTLGVWVGGTPPWRLRWAPGGGEPHVALETL